MPARSYDDLLRSLKKGELPPALYLHGPAEILKDEAVHLIAGQALDAAARELNFEQRTIADLDPESLHTLLETLPMFGGRRVVVLRGVEGLKKKPKLREVLIAALGRRHEDTLLILIETAPGESDKAKPDADLVQHTYAVTAEGLDPERTVRWLRRRAEASGVSFAEGAAEHLAGAVGYDLSTLRAELDKLSSLGSEQAVTVEQVGDVVGIRQGETVNDWRIAVLEDDSPRALRLLGPLLMQSGNSGVKLVSLLGTALVAQGLARARYDRGDRGARLASSLFQSLTQTRPFGIGEWKQETERWARLAPAWPPARIQASLRAALAADQALKETRISDERGVLTDLVLALAGSRDGGADRVPAPHRGRTPAGV
jgi:DNA polymerase-3 subunit delta